MNRRGFIRLLISSATLLGTKTPLNAIATKDILVFDEHDKRSILDYVYALIDAHFGKSEYVSTPRLSQIYSAQIYESVFISILRGGKVVACYGSSCKTQNQTDGIITAIKNSTAKCLRAKKSNGKLKVKYSKDIEIVVHLLENGVRVNNDNYENLSTSIELGIHSLKLESKNGYSWYLVHVPITRNWSLKTTLKKLSMKSDLPKYAYLSADTKLLTYDTSTFKGGRKGEIVDLYRYNIHVRDEDISQELLVERLILARDWLLENVNPTTNRLEYMYLPVSDTYSDENNNTRHLAVLSMMTELNIFLGDNSLKKLIKKSVDYYTTKIKSFENHSIIDFGNDSKISYSAFMILALVNLPEYSESIIKANSLAEGLLNQQRDDGSYNTSFIGKGKGIDYYPGEAMLSLMRLYEITNDQRLLESVKKAFPWYRSYWRGNKNTAFIPWHTQVYYILAQYDKDVNLKKFIYEMNDWLIDNYQIFESEYQDKIGGFKKKNPGNSTSSYMEGVNDAYATAKFFGDEEQILKYGESLRKGMRFVLQTQFTEENSFWCANPKRVIGGFRRSLTNSNQRNDYAQHAVYAIIKAYKYRAFK